MKERTRKILLKMSALTEPKCATCPNTPKTRCCDKYFCDLATITAKSLGGPEIKPTGHPTLPYMGPKGCVMPPEFRPVCTGFVCPQHLKNPGFRSKWENLQQEFNENAEIVKAVVASKEIKGELIAAIERFREEHKIIEEKNG